MDPITIAALIGGAGALIGGGMSLWGSHEQSEAIKSEGGQNREVDWANLVAQQQNYEYQKGIQQQIFQREDNATQRRVADLKAAGLSPVLAAGSAANAGAVIKTEAPQNEADYHEKSAAAAARLQGYIQSAQYAQTFAQIQATAAQTRSTLAGTKATEAGTQLSEITTKNFQRTTDANNRLTHANAAEKEWNTQISKYVGAPTTANSDLSTLIKGLGQVHVEKDKVKTFVKRVAHDTTTDVKSSWKRFQNRFEKKDSSGGAW